MAEAPLSQPPIAVVVGCRDARGSVAACLASLREQGREVAAEIVAVDGSSDGSAEIIAREFPEVRLIRAPESALVPELWGRGIPEVTAPLVAFTNAGCIPSSRWLPAILRTAGAEPRFAGWGGPIDGPVTGRGIDWAVYFARYSAYMPPLPRGAAQEIPGDNAAYRRSHLARDWSPGEGGFWETLFHRRLRARGEALYASPEIVVRQGSGAGVRRFAADRLRHGRHFGATRPCRGATHRALRATAAPALVPLLLTRIGRRVARRRRDWLPHFALSLPWLVLFLSSWSLGEARGTLAPGRPAP